MTIARPKIPWPRSLIGQILLATACALLLVQGLGSFLVYRAQVAKLESETAHSAAFRLVNEIRRGPRADEQGERPSFRPIRRRHFRAIWSNKSPFTAGDIRLKGAEAELTQILSDQAVNVTDVMVIQRDMARDADIIRRFTARNQPAADIPPPPVHDGAMVTISGARLANGQWVITRTIPQQRPKALVISVLWQTLLIYLVIIGAVALILRRITQPLAALTRRYKQFATVRSLDEQLTPQGPDDIRHLIIAHNALETRIVALLDEKDVMLGAIGHDLKTPLAALRVRIESVPDDTERERMAATIEDITRTLDDILSLARVGRPSDPLERTELSALVLSVVEEYEDMNKPVELGDTVRIALELRPTWLRRALRNLIGNALRYGKQAHVSVARENDMAVIRIADDGPGIPEECIAAMMNPFTRGDPSRNTGTGGAGLGLALASAIAEQHNGSIRLENRIGPDSKVQGLLATLTLPIAPA